MIIDCISDLHGFFPKLQGGDLLIVAGDLTATHKIKELSMFCMWLDEQKYKKKIFIGGNHDTFFMNDSLYHHAMTKNYDYLCNSGTQFEGLKIWGNPHSLWFEGINPKCTAFTGSETDLKSRYDMIPDNTDILISHSPPYGILDGSFGSTSLRSTIERIQPRLNVFGHIHEGYGKMMLKCTPRDVLCVNASIMNEHYKPVNKPVRVEL